MQVPTGRIFSTSSLDNISIRILPGSRLRRNLADTACGSIDHPTADQERIFRLCLRMTLLRDSLLTRRFEPVIWSSVDFFKLSARRTICLTAMRTMVFYRCEGKPRCDSPHTGCTLCLLL